MSVICVGTMAFDAIETPFGKTDKIVGGSATYVAYAAGNFVTPVQQISIVGYDFPKEEMDELIRMAQELFDEAENSAIKAETKQKEILEKKEKTIEELKEYQTKIKPPVQPISIPSTK